MTTLPVDEILSKINQILKHDLKQDANRAKIKLQCLSLVLDLYGDETYSSKVENLFQYDLDQNPQNCLTALEVIFKAIELEEDIATIVKNSKFDK